MLPKLSTLGPPVKIKLLLKIDGVVTLVTDPSRVNFATKQNSPILDLYCLYQSGVTNLYRMYQRKCIFCFVKRKKIIFLCSNFYVYITGVHPCSCNSPHLPAPDTQITNPDGMALCQNCVTKWESRGGVGITFLSNIHVLLITPAIYQRS